MATYFEGTWDTANDFAAWATSGVGSDITFDRVAAPSAPWIGGLGRIRTTWTAGAGLVTFKLVPTKQDTPGRTKRVALALNVRQVTMTDDFEGPFRITARNDAAGALNEQIEIVTTGAFDASPSIRLYNVSANTLSTQRVDLSKFMNEWLVLEMFAQSTGSAAPYTTKAWCDVWVYRAGRLKFVTRLTVADYSGAIYDFDKFEVSYANLNKNVDQFEFWVDELRVESGGGAVALPRLPYLSPEAYQARVRVRRWDRASSTWKSAWDVDPRAVANLSCSFLAHRVEDRCEIELVDPGRYTTTEAQDVLDDLEQNTKALYRLDVYAPDATYRDPQFPSTWRDDMVFWSGVLQRREPDHAQAGRGVKLAAVGWTEHLKRLTVSKKWYYKQTVGAVLSSVFSAVSSTWPGTIALVTRSGGIDSRLVLSQVGWDSASLDQVLADLAQFGNFFYGVSVSGYPSFEQQGSGAEFRLVFFEPRAEVDVAVPSGAGLGEECGVYLDIQNDRRLTDLKVLVDNSKYANRWDVTGDEVFVDLASIVVAADRDEVQDNNITFTASGGTSGAFQWEQGFVGFELVLRDFARRSINVTDDETGELFAAGRLDELPSSFRRLDGEAAFLVNDYQEIVLTTTAQYKLGNFPTDNEDLAGYPSIGSQAIRYLLRPNGVRVQRAAIDAEDNSATGREAIAQPVQNSEVRGWQGAGTLALGARWAERRNSEQVRLTIRGWTRVANGSRNQQDNLFAVAFGAERSTLCGTTAQGGDGWKYGDDERMVGGSRRLDVRAVEMRLAESGWDASFVLAAAPRDLTAILLPRGTALLGV